MFHPNPFQRILNQDPKKRPTMDQLKSDAFFAGIGWDALFEKKIQPPTKLAPVVKSGKNLQSSQEVDMIFEDGCENHLQVLNDKDYDEANKTYNRVKNYSFERTTF